MYFYQYTESATEGDLEMAFIKKMVSIPDTAQDPSTAFEIITGVGHFAADDSGTAAPIYSVKPNCIVTGNWQDYPIVKVPNSVDPLSDFVDENGRYHIKVYISAAGEEPPAGNYYADFTII